MKAYQPIPIIAEFTNEDGSDNLKETIEANYRKVKEEILSLVDSEIMRIKNDPKLAHLIKCNPFIYTLLIMDLIIPNKNQRYDLCKISQRFRSKLSILIFIAYFS